VRYDPDTCWWRTAQCLFPEALTLSWLILPRWGSMQGGALSERTMSAHLTAGTASGSPLPTPSANSYGTNQGGAAGRVGKVRPSLETMARHVMWPTLIASDHKGSLGEYRGDGRPGKRNLAKAVKMWPTPRAMEIVTGINAQDGDGLTSAVTGKRGKAGGALNPTWVEWLMGWPLGWSDLRPLATGRFQQWLRLHGRR